MNNRRFPIIIVFVAFLSMYGWIGCQQFSENPPILKDGTFYGITQRVFTGRYWDYYERGRSFAEGKFWEQAESDFRQAISVLSKDERRIRTYGRHLTDYLPHRELGISLYHQQRYEEAVKELETSMETVSSARAAYYLDNARKAFIERNQSDTSKPEIIIYSPSPNRIVNNFSISLTGKVTDDQFVKAIRINGRSVHLDHSEKQITFDEQMAVQKGKNDWLIEAEDLTGKMTVSQLTIYGDHIGPVLNIDESNILNPLDSTYQLKGYAFDDSEIKSIRINNQVTATFPGRETVLDQRIRLFPGQEQIWVAVEDVAGNITEASIPLLKPFHQTNRFQLFFAEKSHPPSVLLASADQWLQTRQNYFNQRRSIIGEYHALIIGINAYQKYDRLMTAVNDATTLKDILIRRYGFQEHNIVFRIDASADFETLTQDMNSLSERLTENDNLLVYFAGHGELDALNKDGYWIPVDGKPDDPSTWITNSSIQQRFGGQIRAKHVIVISDSCYSGFLIHQPIPKKMLPDVSHTLTNEETFLTLAMKPSREALASGGIQPVEDFGRGKHSVFAGHLLKALEENQESFVSMDYLFKSVVWQSVYDATIGHQEPCSGRLNSEADKGGKFVLMLHTEDSQNMLAKNNMLPQNSNKIERGEIPADNDPPYIEIERWQENQTLYEDHLVLVITARDISGIQWIKINGQKIVKKPGRNTFHVNHIAPLTEGTNEFVITAMDQIGNEGHSRIRIQKKLKTIYQPDSRMSVVMLPFDINAQESETIMSHRIETILWNRLVNSGRFNMKLRKTSEKESIAHRLYDQLIEYWVRPNNILMTARNAGADFVLRGTVIADKDRLDIVVSLHDALNSEQDETIVSVNVYEEEPIHSDLIQNLCDAIAFRLKEELPIIEGQVITTKGKTVIVDIGKKDRIKNGMQVVFFEEIPDSDVEEIGAARIDKVWDNYSDTSRLNPKDPRNIRSGMKLVTR